MEAPGRIVYNPAHMTADLLFRFVFVLYFTLVGVVLVLVPWSPGWDHLILGLAPAGRFLGMPVVRGAVSGFGLVHLVWGVHDFQYLLRSGHDDPRAPFAGDH